MRGGFIELRTFEIKNIPITYVPNKEKSLIENVKRISLLNEKLSSIGNKKTDERVKLEKEISRIDKEIDKGVYKIYGITLEEQKIIEGSLK